MSQEKIADVWNEILGILENKIPDTTFSTWILPLEPQYYDENSFVVHTGQAFAPNILRKNHNEEIIDAINQITGRTLEFKIIYDEELAAKFKKRASSRTKKDDSFQTLKPKYDSLTQMQSSNLNLKYKFENFVVGSNNKLAFVAAQTVAQHPGEKYNPLYIYGGPGLGKTHIMQALGHYIIKNKPELKVQFVQAEEFVNDVVNALANGGDRVDKMNKFRNKYRKTDVLLIDDIQLIAGKTRTEEEVFNTFNTLHSAGKQIVITSDRTPKEIPSISDRLVSRFEWGLMADIQVPDVETRMAILMNLSQNSEIKVPPNIIEFLATVYSNNIRELEGAFNRVTAYASINEVELSLENVKKIIGYSEHKKDITIESIIDEIAHYYNVSAKDMKGASRSQKIAEARQMAIYLARDLTNLSFPSIGDYFGKKHTTIIYSYDKIKKELNTNSILAQTVSNITNKLNK